MKYRNLIISGGVAFSVFLLFLYTSSCLPLVWDEGAMVSRSDKLAFWFQRVASRTDSLELLFSPPTLKEFCYSDEGHPHFPVFLNAIGRTMAPSFLPMKTRLRFGNICFFSLALGVVFFRLKKDFSTKTSVLGILSILLIPRLFAHIQIAFYDSPLVSAWLLSWAFFPDALKSKKGAVLFGGCAGLAIASKFPGVGVLLPPMLWLMIRFIVNQYSAAENKLDYRLSDLLKQALLALIAALFVFWLFNPRLWLNPLAGIQQFYYLNTHRDINIAVLFFGTMYDLDHSLPWYNTLVWTAITVPIGLLILSGFGVVAIIRDQDKRWSGLLIFLNMSVLLLMRALPGTPVHDGIRLFVPAFAFLAIIAAIGGAGRKKCFTYLIVVVYAASLFNMFWYAPQWLSFYNLAIGGLPGAVRAGMEPTYYWDGLDDEVFDWLRSNTKEGENIAFSAHSYNTLRICFSEKDISIPFGIADGTTTIAKLKSLHCRYYVLQRRPSAEFDRDKQLIEHRQPVFTKTIRKGGWRPWNLGSVPVIEIYDLNSE